MKPWTWLRLIQLHDRVWHRRGTRRDQVCQAIHVRSVRAALAEAKVKHRAEGRGE